MENVCICFVCLVKPTHLPFSKFIFKVKILFLILYEKSHHHDDFLSPTFRECDLYKYIIYFLCFYGDFCTA